MIDYDELNDREKSVDYPEEFIEELRAEFRSGDTHEALARAEKQNIDIQQIIE
ncbi:MAG TPA: hypothetical protein VM077_06140 [Candidatus Limnocylindrales bacterium]|nr:hypothetical protein [Candidatus Limnocylindrales bacterium]